MSEPESLKHVEYSSMADGRSNRGKMTLSNLTEDEVGMLERFIQGLCHISLDGQGRVVSVPMYDELPDQIEDTKMLPFWRKWEGDTFAQTVMKDLDLEAMEASDSPGIIVEHLCGYNYTEENYKKYANRLTDYGFDELRSKRGSDGKYWSKWILCGYWMAKGDLGDHVSFLRNSDERLSKDEMLRHVVRYISQNISCGSLSVYEQRMAMTLD